MNKKYDFLSHNIFIYTKIFVISWDQFLCFYLILSSSCWAFIASIYYIIEFKILWTDWLKKKYVNSAAQLNAAQAADCCAVHVAQTQVKRMIEWQNANKEKQETILNHIKMHVMQEKEHQDLFNK